MVDCEGIDPSAALDWNRPRERLKCEYRGAKMASENLTPAQKWSLVIAGAFWMAWTAYLAVVQPSLPNPLMLTYLLYVMLLAYAFGRIHKIPMDQIREAAMHGVNVSIGNADTDTSDDGSSDADESN